MNKFTLWWSFLLIVAVLVVFKAVELVLIHAIIAGSIAIGIAATMVLYNIFMVRKV